MGSKWFFFWFSIDTIDSSRGVSAMIPEDTQRNETTLSLGNDGIRHQLVFSILTYIIQLKPTSTVIIEGNTTLTTTARVATDLFRPRIIFIKSIDQQGEWVVYDTARNIDKVDSVLNWDSS